MRIFALVTANGGSKGFLRSLHRRTHPHEQILVCFHAAAENSHVRNPG